jgi:uncharacterized protein (TIGR02594 family)
VEVTLYDIAARHLGLRELAGERTHPLIAWWHSLCFDGNFDVPDETSWCSSAINGWAWILDLPRSGSALARSWLKVGTPVGLQQAKVGYDVVILSRDEAGPWAGHVGLYAGGDSGQVLLLGGNQANAVNISPYPVGRVIGVRRLYEATI